jgi:hypothetical protein
VLLPFCLLLVASPALPSAGLFAAQGVGVGAITGIVRAADRGTPIPGARVSLVGTQHSYTTTTRGEFSFQGLAPGRYLIQATAIGFATLSSTVDVKARETLEIEFETEPEAARLPDLAVTERPEAPADFVRRSSEGGGRYIDRAAIERRNAGSLGDLLRTVPGLRVNCRPGRCRIELTRSRNCALAYWVDGMPADAAAIMAHLPRELEGVEIYSGFAETPPELYQRNTCGAIAIWSRVPPPRRRP